MQVGADAPQRLLIQRGGPAGRLTDALVQARVLLEYPLQLAHLLLQPLLLMPNGVAAALHDARHQQVGEQARDADHDPRPKLGGANLGIEGVGQLVELGHADHPPAAGDGVAHRLVYLDQA